MTKFITPAIAAGIASFAVLPVQAQPNAAEQGFIAFVSYSDLNLASAAGARTLENRIEVAADRICGFTQAPRLVEALRVHNCRDAGFNSARPQANPAVAIQDHPTGRTTPPHAAADTTTEA